MKDETRKIDAEKGLEEMRELERSSKDLTLKEGEVIGIEAEEAGSTSSRSDADNDAETRSIGGQTNVLSTKMLMVAFPALSVALFVSFIDQTSVSTSIPAISSDLNTGSTTSWIGGSFLIASTAFQLINGRLSDIFGRKNCLLACLALLAIGDLLCGFAKSKEWLFACRAIAGIGGGGVNSIAMIIVSDITTLENRGKFQGIIGAVIALANGSGPFIGGALVDQTSWRWVFWIVPMLAAPCMLVILFFLPLKHKSGNYREKMKKIDYGGVILNIAAVLIILIPLSGGGVTYAWSSPLVISMITVGAVLAVAFVLYEWKLAPIPIMPLRLFKAPHCKFLYPQNFFTGLCFFGNFFYCNIYFQSVLKYSALESGALLLPLIIFTSITSIGSGQYMSRFHRYFEVVTAGFTLWTIGTGLKCIFDRDTKLWVIIVTLIIEGLGVGLTLQPTLLAILANTRSEDRAVSTGLRNFIRTIGGAFGLVISGAILSNTLRSRLAHLSFIAGGTIDSLTSSTYALDHLNISSADKNLVLDAYMDGLKYVFILYAVAAGSNLLLSLGIGNTSLKKPAPVDTIELREEAGSFGNDDSVAVEPPAVKETGSH